MEYTFLPQGVCCKKITFSINKNIITNIVFYGGCNGNLKAISSLCNGLTVQQIEEKLKGNICGWKATSCADQFAIAVRKAYEEANKN